MAFCGQCGTQIDGPAAFCPNCGAAVSQPVNDFADEELRKAEARYSGGSDYSYGGGTDAGYGSDSTYGAGYGSGTGYGAGTGYTGGRGPSWDYTRTTKYSGFLGFLEYYPLMWKNYANKKGRATRMEFWSIVLCNFVISFLLGLIPGTAGTVISFIYSLVVLVPTICVYTRRAHDLNQSGGHVALIYIFMIVGELLAGIGIGTAALIGVYSMFYYTLPGFIIGGIVACVIGVILLIVALVLLLRLGLKQSWPDDNEYGPYPHKTL
ncbi:MAG: DUF805 domain-containing protein [Lachnospiraceae bacterium]|nr:DUF805 domain-containing protein [Lachnospiraceae bacterium]